MQGGFGLPQADRDSGSAQGQEEPGFGASLLAGMRNNPVLTGALAAGLAAVTGPQMLKALAATAAKKGAWDGQKFTHLIRMLEPHADEATEAWKMVGGSGPTKLKHLGGGVDAQAFQVMPGGTVLKLARPTTHMGFDPHAIAENAPRNVMLPVLEHGKFADELSGKPDLSWFVQPRAHVLNDFYDNARRDKALLRMGQTAPDQSRVFDELSRVLEQEHPEWSIVDRHAGNAGRWAGKDWVIDLGSMSHTPTRNALRHKPPAPESSSTLPTFGPQAQIPVRDTPITTPPGTPSSLSGPQRRMGEFKDIDTSRLPEIANERALVGDRAGVPAWKAHEMLLELLRRLNVEPGKTPDHIANLAKELKRQHGPAADAWWPRQ